MRILKFAFFLILILVIAAAASAPWIAGNMFRTNYSDSIAAIQNYLNSSEISKRAQFNINVAQYDQGWLTSDIKIVAKFTTTTDQPHTYQFSFNEHVIHGPVIYNVVKHRWMLAEALIKANLHLPKEIESKLLGDKANLGIMQTQSIIGFDNSYQNTARISSIHLTNNGVRIDWDGITGDGLFTFKNNKKSMHLLANILVSEFNLTNNDRTLSTKKLAIKYDISTDASGLFNDTWYLDFPGYDYSSSNVTSNLRDLKITNNTNMTSQRFGQNFHISLGQLVVPQYTLNQSNLDLSIQDVSTPGLNNLFMAANTYSRGLHTQAERDQYLATVIELFTPTTRISGNSTVDTSSGKLVTDWMINWPDGVKTVDDVAKNASVTTNIRISNSLLNTLIDYVGQQIQQKQDAQNNSAAAVAAADKPITLNMPPAQVQQVVKPSPVDQIKQQIDAYIKAGLIKQEGDDLVTMITVDHGVVKANGLPLQ